MAEHGPRTILHSPKVPTISVGPDTGLKAPLGSECNNTCPKTIEDYMGRSATSAMAEQGPRAILHPPNVPIISVGPVTSIWAPLRMECHNNKSKNH
jgi:hypothetical protein